MKKNYVQPFFFYISHSHVLHDKNQQENKNFSEHFAGQIASRTLKPYAICQTKRPVRYAIGGGPIDPVSGRMLINRSALPIEEPAIAAEVPAVMVKTRQTATEGAVSIATPPPPRQQGKPNTPSTDRTMSLPAPLQQEVNKCHEKSCHIIASNILRVRLHCRIAKIKQMSTNVVEGYEKIYEQRYG